jgi:hypothetical protein
MSKRIKTFAGLAVAAAAGFGIPGVAGAQEPPDQKLSNAAPHRAGLPQLTPTGGRVHVMPTVKGAGALAKALADPGPLLYRGGPIMRSPTLYAIFWDPPKLQNGGPTSIPPHYAQVNIDLLLDYPFHGIDNNSTQYFQTVGTTTTYILNAGGFGGFAVDTSPYPASGCTDSFTPGNCITDAQIQAEIQKVMLSKGWTGGSTINFCCTPPKARGRASVPGLRAALIRHIAPTMALPPRLPPSSIPTCPSASSACARTRASHRRTAIPWRTPKRPSPPTRLPSRSPTRC